MDCELNQMLLPENGMMNASLLLWIQIYLEKIELILEKHIYAVLFS